MKKILFILFIFLSVCAHAQERIGVYDKSLHATELLETDADTIVVGDTTTYPLDVAYIEWSADGIVFRKGYQVNDTWVRYSGVSKQEWDTIRIYIGLWSLSGDTIYALHPTVNMDTVTVADRIDAPIYFLGGDTLSSTNIYNGGDGVDGYTLIYSGDTAVWMPAASGVGETNIMANVGARGVGTYDNKTDTLFNMRNIASLTDLLTVTLDAADSVIDLDLALKTITAGTGLSGGGNMEDNVTINLYIPELLELTSLSYIDKGNDFVAIYDQSAAQHKKINPILLHPDVYVSGIEDKVAPPYLNFTAGDGVSVIGGGNGTVQYSADPITLRIDGVTQKARIDTIDIVGGTGINLAYNDNGIVTISTTPSGLPICDEGQFLAYIGGEWSCVNVCDYICSDTIINIINNYNDTANVIQPSGDVVINFSRLDCEDSTQILATDLAKTTLNLTSIKIVTAPTVGELHYNGVAVIDGQELSVTSGSLDAALYYVSDASTGSAYSDLFTFKLLYSSNADYLGTANVDVSVDACVTESVCFGYLYNWYAVDDSRELTSSADWSVPTNADFASLTTYVGGASEGAKLKKEGTAFWEAGDGTNDYGFNAIGSGRRVHNTGLFSSIIGQFNMMGSGEHDADEGYSLLINDATNQISYGNSFKRYGYSVRLIKDATGIPDGTTTTYTGNDGKVYNAVAINELYWTTENLEETQYRNGQEIPYVEDNTEWANATYGAVCYYENNPNNACKTPIASAPEECYGYLYNYYAFTDSRELTSSNDWIVPAQTDWNTLNSYVSFDYNSLKATGNVFWDTANGTDTTGLGLRGGGFRTTSFSSMGSGGEYANTDNARASYRDNGTFSFVSVSTALYTGVSVRLLYTGVGTPTSYTGNDGKVYDVVQIGTQYWLAENLEETEYRNGDPIPEEQDNTAWSNLTTGAWCVYENNANYKCK